jgi:hypothetical protein
MKQILILILLFVQNLSFGQTYEIDKNTNLLTYQKVVNIDSMNADKIYSTMKLTLAELYKSYKNVQQVEDKESHTIVIKAYFDTYVQVGLAKGNFGGCNYTLTIQCKDNKYRILIDNISHTCQYYTSTGKYSADCTSGGAIENEKADGGWVAKMPEKRWKQIKEFSKNYCENSGVGIETYFKKNIVKTTEDW